ncbi:LPS export ABC transporter periplasmic protein LptC [Pseudoalteromonas sp. H105]|jgi:lipopolysaccharide export system protein LptC|uniref:LPS export ABC transporter periplasmic protein LptC n=1 Tax=Pseudoalteromonas sp. H105 TaxID=1348393 RepID=UPI000732229E|nr:LPS export ABC transporter periplasmic protein LptC [Pseudoalteromonas sp. H105]KTF14135.1 LPS export ABC transporter periplasmic protein LptC [Pseudoalteromonas sp. H105]
MNSARLILSVLFIGCMVWLWYPYLNQTPTETMIKDDIIAEPDYTAVALKQTAFDAQGKISHKVTAAKMELYQQLGFTYFEKPIFTLYNQQKTWQINANEATLYENKQLILEGDVVAKNLTDNAMIEHINANNIHVDIELQTMGSEQPVELIGPNLKITGRGLQADLKAEVIELINHTRTIYYDQ